MAQVSITVNGRNYNITCDDGQEQRLQQLAGFFDRHVSELAQGIGQIGDARLMLLSALTVCDELFDARARLKDLENATDKLDEETIGGASRVIDAATRRIENMAERLAQH